ncbi:MAG: response regulator [Burkholderiaceae bacterium]
MSDLPVVLVVADAPSSLGVLCEALEQAFYTVLIAKDGETALERLGLVTPDAILLDAMLPGLSGFDICRRIKETPAWMHIPIIFMTGLSDTQYVLEGFVSGGVDYVVKPLRVNEVLARLNTHVKNAMVTRLAREAIDIAGMGVIFVDTLGRISWISPQAAAWLKLLAATSNTTESDRSGYLPPSLDAALKLEGGAILLTTTEPLLSVRNMGAAMLGETMLLVERQQKNLTSSAIFRHTELTLRETEVLSWIAKGKTNQDIAEILSLSLRTVKKHIENIFKKLGVENRTAAVLRAQDIL